MTCRLIRFSACLNGLSYFAIKLSGTLFWLQLYLVNFLVTQSSLDCIQRVGLCQGPVAGSELALSSPRSLSLEQKTATIQTIPVEMSAMHSGVSTSDPSALHRMLRFTSVFQVHQSASAQNLQA